MVTHNFDETLYGRWCIDSETGEKVLIDLKTGEKICTWVQTQSGDEDDGN